MRDVRGVWYEDGAMIFAIDDTSGAGVEAARESARGAAERLLMALEHGTLAEVALAAGQAYLLVGRLAVLARADTAQA